MLDNETYKLIEKYLKCRFELPLIIDVKFNYKYYNFEISFYEMGVKSWPERKINVTPDVIFLGGPKDA